MSNALMCDAAVPVALATAAMAAVAVAGASAVDTGAAAGVYSWK
jgi:hypothetical protein